MTILRLTLLGIFILIFNITQAVQPPLPPDQAFQFNAVAKDYQTIVLNWQIAPGYYLYKDKFRITAIKPKGIELIPPVLPLGAITKNIPSVGQLSVYKNNIYIIQPILNSKLSCITLRVHYQGCSSQGFCYPPVDRAVTLTMQKNFNTPTAGIPLDNSARPQLTPKKQATTSQSAIQRILTSTHYWQIILGFITFGILIAFTPCVLPMVPILSGIIVGQGKISHVRAFILSLSYVLGMAITYAVAGMLFGYLGGSLQAAFQRPWLILLFASIFIAMALSLFDLYTIQLPNKLRSRLALAGDHQKHGTIIGVFFMGVFSTLVLSPCVTPPLVAVLTFISQSGKIDLGGIALFSMGLGMGIPLLLIGSFGPKLLPKNGAWMITIKHFLGVMLLAVSISLIGRLLPTHITMLLWATLAMGYALNLLGIFKTHTNTTRKIIALLLLGYSSALIIGTIQGSTNPLKPISLSQASKSLTFTTVKTVDDVYRILANPSNQDKPVLLDFYADWCTACHEMENRTFNQPAIQQQLQHYVRLRADVTRNTLEDKLLEQHFGVVAPPTLILFDAHHQQLPDQTVVGFIEADKLSQRLSAIQK
jgi:thiol:disulfide interchange protein DsbD